MSNINFASLYDTNNVIDVVEPTVYEEACDFIGHWAGEAVSATTIVATDIYAGTTKALGIATTCVTQNVKHTKAYFNAGRDQSRDRIAARIAKHLGK